jgi:hypothetical protein
MPSKQSLLTDWGFYRYRGQEWLNPFDALEVAIELGDHDPDIAFFMPKADLIDWTAEPEEALPELYKRRARELRESYDYLILMYSGGSDSHQAMMSFVNAGVHLDEVRTFYPMQWADQVEKVRPVTRDHPLGHLYEYHYAVVPGLRTLSLRSPLTKISVVDTTDAYTGDMDEWFEEMEAQHRNTGGVHGLFAANFRARQERDIQRDVENMGRKVCVIYGADKPPLYLDGNELYVRFLDTWRFGISAIWAGRTYDTAMFYWGDMRIVCKQAHIIKRALARDRRILKDTDAHRRLIYPDWCWSYQQREALHDALLMQCAGERVKAIAEARTRHYNNRYGVLGLSIEDDPVVVKRQLRFLFARESMPYLVGELEQ